MVQKVCRGGRVEILAGAAGGRGWRLPGTFWGQVSGFPVRLERWEAEGGCQAPPTQPEAFPASLLPRSPAVLARPTGLAQV